MGAFSDYVNSLNPEAHYRLNETSGTVANDSSTNGNHGGIVGNPTLGTAGLLINDNDTAMAFDGSNDYVTTSVTPPSGAYSVSLLFQMTTIGSVYSLIRSGLGLTQLILQISGSGVLQFYHYNGALHGRCQYQLVAGEIYSVSVIFDGTDNHLYVNGVLIDSLPSVTVSTSATWSIGRNDANVNEYFEGVIDEVLLFDRAITEEEVLTLHALSRINSANYLSHSAYIQSLSAVSSHYRLNEASGTTVADSKGSNDGSIVGTLGHSATGLIESNSDTCLDFPDTGHIELPIQSFVGFHLTFTLDDTSAYRGLFGVGDSDTNREFIYIKPEIDQLRFYRSSGGSNNLTVCASPENAISVGETYSVTVQYDGTDTVMYLNGVRQDVSSAGNHLTIQNLPPHIGTYSYNGTLTTRRHDGRIDETLLLTTPLTDTQINTLYVASKIDLTALVTPAVSTGTTFTDYVNSLNSLVAYYRLGESSGTTALDETGNYDGTYVGSPTLGATGLLTNDTDTAVDFDGTNDYVLSDTAIPKNDIKSVSVIFKNTTHGDFQGVVGSGGSNSTRWLMYIHPTDKKLTIYHDTGDVIATNDPIVLNKIYCVLLQWNGTELSMYLDGIKQSATHNVNVFLAPTNDTPVSIGTYYYNGYVDTHTKFQGTIDEVAIFDTVLTEEQISTLYALARIDSANYLSHNALITASNPLAHYRLGETSGTVATDETANHHGTYQNTPTLGLPSLVESDPLDKSVRFAGDARVYNNSLDQSFWNTEGSVAIVFKIDAFIDAWGRIFSIGLENVNQMIALTRNNTTNRLTVAAFGGTNLIIPIDIVFGNTYHITITKSVGTVTIYLNGTQIAQTTSWSGTISTNQMYIGDGINAFDNNVSESLDCTIGDFALFDTALTEEQIKTLYTASKIDLTTLIAPATGSTMAVTIVENLIVDNWRGVAHLLDGTLVKIFDMVQGNNDLTFDPVPTEPIALTVLPNHGTQWSASTTYALDDVVYPVDALTVPYFLKCVTAGTSGATEPTWGQGSGQVDGTVTWDYLELMPGAICKYPITV